MGASTALKKESRTAKMLHVASSLDLRPIRFAPLPGTKTRGNLSVNFHHVNDLTGFLIYVPLQEPAKAPG